MTGKRALPRQTTGVKAKSDRGGANDRRAIAEALKRLEPPGGPRRFHWRDALGSLKRRKKS